MSDIDAYVNAIEEIIIYFLNGTETALTSPGRREIWLSKQKG